MGKFFEGGIMLKNFEEHPRRRYVAPWIVKPDKRVQGLLDEPLTEAVRPTPGMKRPTRTA